MPRVKITIEAEVEAWQAFVAASCGDDGPAVDASPADLSARDAIATERLLNMMAQRAADHSVNRRSIAAREQIEAGVEAQRLALVTSTLITVEDVAE